MSKPFPDIVGLISAGSPKRLVGEDGEDYPAYVTLGGRPLISYVVEQALKSQLAQLYIWTNPERVDRLRAIVSSLPNHDKVKAIVPAKHNMFSSMTHTIREYVAPELMAGRKFSSWDELLRFARQHPAVSETAVVHISSDSPLIRSHELDEFCGSFDPATTDYLIGMTQAPAVRHTLDQYGLWDEFSQLPSTVGNFTRVLDESTRQPLSIRINNLHVLKPYKLQAAQYDFLEKIFEQRQVSKIFKWVKLARLIQSVFQLPWLDSYEKKRLLYKTVWHLVLSQEKLPLLIRKQDSAYTSVGNLEENIGFLMACRSKLYLEGRFGAFFDADAQEEYDFLRKHFVTLTGGRSL